MLPITLRLINIVNDKLLSSKLYHNNMGSCRTFDMLKMSSIDDASADINSLIYDINILY